MSAFAGVFTRRPAEDPTYKAHCRVLEAALTSTAPEARFERAARQNCSVWKFDSGAFAEPAFLHDDANTISALAGHPYIETLTGSSRSEHLRFLATAARCGRHMDFAKARGSFSLVYADAQARRLVLATDALGVRPVYFIDDGHDVIFSSTLNLLRAFGSAVTGAADERAAVEMAVFGFALASRSGFRDVQCLVGGSVAQFDSTGVSVLSQYWNMSKLPFISNESIDDSLDAVSHAFEEAVRIRRSTDSIVMATLSGGMDSRAVVASLRRQGAEVHSLNFAPPDSQDFLFGREIAAALGCNHTEVPLRSGSVLERMCFAFEKWQQADSVVRHPASQPRLVWSGDGGSVTMGHVYLTPDMFDAAESGDTDAAVHKLLWDQRWIVPRKVLRAEDATRISSYPFLGLKEVLSGLECRDPGRRLHMMLMATDQRRHMHPYYEAIFAHRSDMQLPFFDRAFVEAVLERPVRPFLNHHFYNKWFGRFQRAVFAVPWQVYPGHEPCPVPCATRFVYQWSNSFDAVGRRQGRDKYVSVVRALLAQRAFAGTAISPFRLRAALVATALRVRDLTYALRFAAKVSDPCAP